MGSPPIIILINKLNFANLFIWSHQNSAEITGKEWCPVSSGYFIIQTISVTSELILGVGPSVYCKKCIIARCSHGNIIQNTFHTLQRFLRSPAHPPSSLTLATNVVFTSFMILPFHERYVLTII